MAQSGKAVFLSYASQDAGAARRIGDALRASGVEVWLDQSELRGGDAWDASIRERIRDCSLFLPLVSATTQSRDEGYFRLEWRLAVERSQLMADDRAFIVPVVIDETPQDNARVPPAFHERQWIRLPGSLPTGDFVARVKDLLERGGSAPPAIHGGSARPNRMPRWPWLALGVAATLTILAAVFARPLLDAYRQTSTRATAPAAMGAPPNSVAVLPFRNLSDDQSNEYFSDGVSEELLTTLQKVSGLQVAARASSFSLKGTQATAQEIGERLGVAHLVEGSVRKAGNTVRITARLSHAATGQQLWSDAYSRDGSDVIAVQTELAQAIAERLHAVIGGTVAEGEKAAIRKQISAATKGGTRNAAAHESYLQGIFHLNAEAFPEASRHLERAVSLDPSFALAWAELSRAGFLRAIYASTAPDYEEGFRLARRAADRAITLAPELAAGWLSRASVQMSADFDWHGAAESLRRAESLAPSDEEVLHRLARLAFALGDAEKAAGLARQALASDPLDARKRILLAHALESLGRYEEAQAQYERVTELAPRSPYAHAGVALMLMRRGRLEEAEREVLKAPVEWERLTVHAQILWALGRKAEANAALKRIHDRFSEVAT